MGRDWFIGGRSICSSKSKCKSSEEHGCITALSHFFHFHHFYFPSRHQPTFDSPSRNPKGLVAPRNSLELTEESPLSTNYKEKESLNISVCRKKSKLRALLVDTSSDVCKCNSPRTKTPNVVARLMGLDLLPDNLDLNITSRNSVRGHRLSENDSGTRSLPGSPRISSARKSDSNIRRLSLQLNKENGHEEFECWRLKELKQDDESRSSRHNGRQLAKQIKEKVITRRLGKDITNMLENRRGGAEQNQVEHKKVRSSSSQKENTISSNPTFVFKEDNNSQQPKKVTLLRDSKENMKRANEEPLRAINGCKKADSDSKFSTHPTTNNRKKQRKSISSLSNHSISDCFDHLNKKKSKKIPKPDDNFNIYVASCADCSTEDPQKKMKRDEEREPNGDTTIRSSLMSKYDEKLPQEPPSSNLCDWTSVSASFAHAVVAEIDFKQLPGVKKLEDEEERVVAEIERYIVDALVLEIVVHYIC